MKEKLEPNIRYSEVVQKKTSEKPTCNFCGSDNILCSPDHQNYCLDSRKVQT